MNATRCCHSKDLQLKDPLERVLRRVLVLGTPLMLDSSVGPAVVSTPGRTVPGLIPVPVGGCRAEGPGCGEPRATRAGPLFPIVGTACPVTLGHSR